MKCPYCNNKVKLVQLFLTKGTIKCSNCNEIFYISKIKLYLPFAASLIFIFGIAMLKNYFDYNKNIYNLLEALFIFIAILYVVNIKPVKGK